MKFVSTRELRNNPGGFRESVAEQDVVLTANGKPFAVVVGVGEEDLEETMDLLRRLRARQAVSRMRARATETGLDRLSDAGVDREIKAARRARGSRR